MRSFLKILVLLLVVLSFESAWADEKSKVQTQAPDVGAGKIDESKGGAQKPSKASPNIGFLTENVNFRESPPNLLWVPGTVITVLPKNWPVAVLETKHVNTLTKGKTLWARLAVLHPTSGVMTGWSMVSGNTFNVLKVGYVPADKVDNAKELAKNLPSTLANKTTPTAGTVPAPLVPVRPSQ